MPAIPRSLSPGDTGNVGYKLIQTSIVPCILPLVIMKYEHRLGDKLPKRLSSYKPLAVPEFRFKYGLEFGFRLHVGQKRVTFLGILVPPIHGVDCHRQLHATGLINALQWVCTDKSSCTAYSDTLNQ
jgi:hypothetical protein